MELNSPPAPRRALPQQVAFAQAQQRERVQVITPMMSAAVCESCRRRRSTVYDVELSGVLFIVCEDCHPLPIR